MTLRRSLTIACGAAVASAALTACGGSTTVVTDTSSTSGHGATAPTSSHTTTAVTSGTGAPPRSLRCTAANLALSFLGQQGATGHGELGFSLRNTGTQRCHTFGYPGVLFLTATGAPLPTSSRRVTQDYFGAVPAVGIDLSPGQSTSFRLGVTHGQSSSAGCVTAAALQVIPPDDMRTLRVSMSAGAYECGTATVSPLRPGASAFG